MKIEIKMIVNEENNNIRADFYVKDYEAKAETTQIPQTISLIIEYIRKRLLDLNIEDNLKRNQKNFDDGFVSFNIMVPNKKCLKELLYGKELGFGDSYSMGFVQQLVKLIKEKNIEKEENTDIRFIEPQKVWIIRDVKKKSILLLAIVFSTLGIGISFKGLTMINISLIELTLGKSAGIIIPVIALTLFGIFCWFFDQPGGRR